MHEHHWVAVGIKDAEEKITVRWRCQPCPDAPNRGSVTYGHTEIERPAPTGVIQHAWGSA